MCVKKFFADIDQSLYPLLCRGNINYVIRVEGLWVVSLLPVDKIYR